MRLNAPWHPSRWLGPAALALAALLLAGAREAGRPEAEPFHSHAGELLVADKTMPDPRFQESVILMVRHGQDGAMGLIVNKTMLAAPLALLFREPESKGPGFQREVPVHYGGPVEPAKGFVLHSREVAVDGTVLVGQAFALTANPAIIELIGQGTGPRQSLIAFGYAGWRPGQLEGEIAHGDWHWAPADEALVFADEDKDKWQKALGRRRIDL